jgi:hypothetical protein
MEGHAVPNPDFDTFHQRRDFESVVAWHAVHQVDVNMTVEEEYERWDDFKPGDDDIVLPMEPMTDVSFWDKTLHG